jgi:hypothetical protein
MRDDDSRNSASSSLLGCNNDNNTQDPTSIDMSDDDSRNSASSSLLGCNNDNNTQDPTSIDRVAFSRSALTKINELKEMLKGTGDDYVAMEKKRLFRELVLIINLATLQSGGELCLDLL